MRVILVYFLLLTSVFAKSQRINEVNVSADSPFVKIRVKGERPAINISKIDYRFLNDSKNTLDVSIHFQGCNFAAIILVYDTSFYVPISLPFDLKMKTIRDTFYQCGSPISPIVTDTFFGSYTQLVSVDEVDVEKQLVHIYPNPLTEKVMIDFLVFDGEKRIQIMDINGRKLNEEFLTFGKTATLDLSMFQSEFYLLQIMSSKGILTRRISIVK